MIFSRRSPAQPQCAEALQSIAARIAIGALLLVLVHAPEAQARDGNGKAADSARCVFSDAAFDPAVTVKALEAYQNAIAQLLKNQSFDELDCIADAARTGKTRFSGGVWKLRYFYIALDEPRPGHATDEDWKQHFKLIEHWRDHNPNSNTAAIAQAESYVQFGWFARGGGFADSVSDSGWKLFAERMEKARKILNDISSTNNDPNWYATMELVAQGQSWDLPKFRALADQAVAFEPGYQYYYRIYANQLQPKWSGQEGDPARYAEEVANRIGGDAGDILYFQIGDIISCGCTDPEISHFSWPRLQKGYAALEKKYGPSLRNLNAFALMASKFSDWVVADPAFKRIGDDWDEDKWQTHDWFQQNRDWAAQLAPMQEKTRTFHAEAEANMKSPEGQAYRPAIDAKLATFAQGCIGEAHGDFSKFELFVDIGKDGIAEEAHTEVRPTFMATCIMTAIYQTYVHKETAFPAPPKVPYYMMLEVDPSTMKAAK
jgi:hypothetical protein